MSNEPQKLSAKADMDKAVACLYIELPERIANDVSKKWQAVKKEYESRIKELEQQLEQSNVPRWVKAED
jgi:hypothetical protein